MKNSWVLVAHVCNPSYSGGRDKDCGSKPAQALSSNPNTTKMKNEKQRAKW
jgi:hypothetical protein